LQRLGQRAHRYAFLAGEISDSARDTHRAVDGTGRHAATIKRIGDESSPCDIERAAL
jgi:hypothetical protein